MKEDREPSPEVIRLAIARIKSLATTRVPHYEQPADSFLENAVRDIFKMFDSEPKADAKKCEHDRGDSWQKLGCSPISKAYYKNCFYCYPQKRKCVHDNYTHWATYIRFGDIDKTYDKLNFPDCPACVPAPKDKGVKRYVIRDIYSRAENDVIEKSDGEYVLWADHEAALKDKDEIIYQKVRKIDYLNRVEAKQLQTIEDLQSALKAKEEELAEVQDVLGEKINDLIESRKADDAKIEALETEVNELRESIIEQGAEYGESLLIKDQLESQLKDKDARIALCKNHYTEEYVAEQGKVISRLEARIAELETSIRTYWVKKYNELQAQLKSARENALEEAVQVCEKLTLKGDYKDCPAAWLKTAFTNFKKSILALSAKHQEELK